MNMTNFDDLYKKHIKEIYRFARYKLKSKENAEDIASETFARLYSQDISQIQNVRAWLYKVCRNLIYDKYVKKPAIEDSQDIENVNEELLLQYSIDTEKVAIDQKMTDLVREEVNKLDEATSEIIVLRLWEELTFSEISEVTAINENVVKSKFYRGISKVKDQITNTKNQRTTKAIVPMILAGLLAMRNDSSFTLQTASAQAIANNLNSNLNINLQSMDPVSSSVTATTASTASAKGGILATTTAKMIMIAVTTAIVAGGIVGGGVYLATRNNEEPTEIEQPEAPEETPGQVEPVAVEPVPEPVTVVEPIVRTPSEITGEIDAEPLTNTIYIGQYNGQHAIYFKRDVDDFNQPSNNSQRILQAKADGGFLQENTKTYADIQNPVRIATMPNQFSAVFTYQLSQYNDFFLISLIETRGDQVKSVIYKIDLKSKQIEEVWSKGTLESRYEMSGFVSTGILSEDDKYLAFSIGPCGGCDAPTPSKTVIINLTTKAEALLGYYGNLRFDLVNNKVIGNEYIQVETAPCGNGGIGCNENGFFVEYQPIGAEQSLALP